MDALLQLLGSLLLAVLLVGALLVGGLKVRLWRTRRRMIVRARQMGGPVAPISIHVGPLGKRIDAALEPFVRDLEAHGFVRIGEFRVENIPVYEMVGLTKEEEDLYAVVGTHPMRGVHMELLQSAPDGRTLAVTNAKQIVPPTAIPGRTVVRKPGADAATLLNEWKIARLTGEVHRTPPEGFAAAFENEYRVVIEFQYREGRLKDVDLDRMSRQTGMEADPQTVAFIREAQARRAAEKAERTPVAVLAADPELSRAWDAMLDESIAITYKSTDAEIIAMLNGLGDVPDDLSRRLQALVDKSPEDRFEAMLAELGWEGRVELVSTMKGEKSIHVYRRTGT